MSGFGYICGLVLAAVFVRAGAAKLVRPEQTSAGFELLGVPKPAWAARVVPVVELGLALTLLTAPRVGGIASLIVLGAFTRFLGRALAAGSTAPCNCFGTASADPISLVDVVRNLLLGGLAAAALTATVPRSPALPAILAAAVLVGAGRLVLRRAGRAGRGGQGAG